MVKQILFVCTENSARSQIAEGLFNHHNKNPEYEGISAGTNPSTEIKPLAIAVMKEKCIDISKQKPKLLDLRAANNAYKIFTMGCIKGCPITPKEKTTDWNLKDPAGKTIEEYRKVRDEIEEKVNLLISALNS